MASVIKVQDVETRDRMAILQFIQQTGNTIEDIKIFAAALDVMVLESDDVASIVAKLAVLAVSKPTPSFQGMSTLFPKLTLFFFSFIASLHKAGLC